MSATIQIRIDDRIKQAVKKILDTLGLDFSAAIKMYLNQIVAERGLPFRPRLTENGLTEEQEAGILKASEEARRGINIVARTTSPEETQKFLDSLKKNKSAKNDHRLS